MDEKKTAEKTLISKLQALLTLFAILAPIFYLVGLSYNQSVLTAYGVSADAFPINIQDTYVAAYMAISLLLIDLSNLIKDAALFIFSPPQLSWVVGIFCLIVASFFVLSKRSDITNHYVIQKAILGIKKILTYLHWENNSFTAAFGLTGIIVYFLFTIFYVLASLSIIWLLPIIFGLNPGKNLANENIEEYLEKGCFYKKSSRWSNCKVLQSKEGKILYEGIVVASSETRIAFFTKSGAVITKIPDGAVILNIPKDF